MVENGPKRRPGRPRTFDADEVLDKVIDVFWELGYDASDTETLAKRTGLTKPSLYNAFGPKEEPERIVLPDAQQDGTYRVLLSYVEDCSSVPSGIVAAILGISVDALIAYLTGGIGVGFGGEELADAIDDVCFNHSSAAVTVTVFVNGQVIAEAPVTMGSQGDFVYAVDIERAGGVFTVR